MTITRYFLLLLLSLFILMPGCGGGGAGVLSIATSSSGSGGGIGGTGLSSSSGTISGFGSIFVNGIEYETGNAEILLDGESAGEDVLGLGMVVRVTGTVNEDGQTGTAERVVADDELAGPIQAVELDQDGDSTLLTVLGTRVIVERIGTVFAGLRFDNLAVGSLVELSGFVDDRARLRATRIEGKGDFIEGVSAVKLKGTVSNLVATEFVLNSFAVDFAGADLSRVPGGVLADGMRVQVRGTLEGQRIVANRVAPEEAIGDYLDADGDVSVEGVISSFASASDFRVNGVSVNASAARLVPAELPLAAGQFIEAEGQWDGNVLMATTIEARRGRVEMAAAVTSVDRSTGELTLQFAAGTVTVSSDSRTLLDDETGAAQLLTLGEIAIGDFLEVEALRVGDTLLATRIDRSEPDDEILQAPVESFVPGSSITLLGLTFETGGAEFESENDQSITDEQFYTILQAGLLVKVKDEQFADGIADEVEFEFADSLDGDSEFDDEDDKSDDGTDSGDKNDSGSEMDSDDETDSDDEMNCEDEADCEDETASDDEMDCEDEADCEDETASDDEMDCEDEADCEDETASDDEMDCEDEADCEDETASDDEMDCEDEAECEDETASDDEMDCEDEADCEDETESEDQVDCEDGAECEDETDCEDEVDCEDETDCEDDMDCEDETDL